MNVTSPPSEMRHERKPLKVDGRPRSGLSLERHLLQRHGKARVGGRAREQRRSLRARLSFAFTTSAFREGS
jgi:hypothetical protein